MVNETMWHAEKAVFRAITGGPYRMLGPYGTIISGNTLPAKGTIPVSIPKAGTFITQGVMVRGTNTKFKSDVQEEDYIHASDVVRKVRHVITDELLELEQAFSADISVGTELRVCRPQVYKEITAKSVGEADATALQEVTFPQDTSVSLGGAPISYDASTGKIDFTLSV